MPVKRGTDSKGAFYRWGNSGKKYHYTVGNGKSRERAKKQAERQARAIYASGYRE